MGNFGNSGPRAMIYSFRFFFAVVSQKVSLFLVVLRQYCDEAYLLPLKSKKTQYF